MCLGSCHQQVVRTYPVEFTFPVNSCEGEGLCHPQFLFYVTLLFPALSTKLVKNTQELLVYSGVWPPVLHTFGYCLASADVEAAGVAAKGAPAARRSAVLLSPWLSLLAPSSF